jgi:hypothetical protein
MECFKIMNFEDGKLKTLFHGVNGSKTVAQWTPIHAEMKWNAVDGASSGPKYTSGWHVLETVEQAKAYLTKFKNLKTKVIVKCKASGQIWKKKHSPFEGLWLAEILEIRGVVMFSMDLVDDVVCKIKPTIRENAKTLIDNLVEATREHESEIVIAGGMVDDNTVSWSDLTNARKKLEKFINTLIEEAY